MKLSQRFTSFTAAAISPLALLTTAPSATNYCGQAEYQQVYAYSDYTKDSHLHLDVGCPYGYRAISCEFDVGGKDDHDQNHYFVTINDASPSMPPSYASHPHRRASPTQPRPRSVTTLSCIPQGRLAI